MQTYINTNSHMSRKTLPSAVRSSVWNKYIFRKHSVAKCMVGSGNQISQSNFQCGHIKSVKHGGNDSIENLRPICALCNSSMGTRNMKEFMREILFYISASKRR